MSGIRVFPSSTKARRFGVQDTWFHSGSVPGPMTLDEAENLISELTYSGQSSTREDATRYQLLEYSDYTLDEMARRAAEGYRK